MIHRIGFPLEVTNQVIVAYQSLLICNRLRATYIDVRLVHAATEAIDIRIVNNLRSDRLLSVRFRISKSDSSRVHLVDQVRAGFAVPDGDTLGGRGFTCISTAGTIQRVICQITIDIYTRGVRVIIEITLNILALLTIILLGVPHSGSRSIAKHNSTISTLILSKRQIALSATTLLFYPYTLNSTLVVLICQYLTSRTIRTAHFPHCGIARTIICRHCIYAGSGLDCINA